MNSLYWSAMWFCFCGTCWFFEFTNLFLYLTTFTYEVETDAALLCGWFKWFRGRPNQCIFSAFILMHINHLQRADPREQCEKKVKRKPTRPITTRRVEQCCFIRRKERKFCNASRMFKWQSDFIPCVRWNSFSRRCRRIKRLLITDSTHTKCRRWHEKNTWKTASRTTRPKKIEREGEEQRNGGDDWGRMKIFSCDPYVRLYKRNSGTQIFNNRLLRSCFFFFLSVCFSSFC